MKLAKSSVDINTQSKQSIINYLWAIQRLQFSLTSVFATLFDPCLVCLALILSTFRCFIRHFRTVSKVNEKGCVD